MSEHLDRPKELLEQVRPGLAATHALEFKNLFGATAGYVNGAIFISSGRFGIALRPRQERSRSCSRRKAWSP